MFNGVLDFAAAPFGGDEKKGAWILANTEKRMVSWQDSWHVRTYTGLRLISSFIVLLYPTDMLNGTGGRYRYGGLIKGCFHMDHFLDYLFLASPIVGYELTLPRIP